MAQPSGQCSPASRVEQRDSKERDSFGTERIANCARMRRKLAPCLFDPARIEMTLHAGKHGPKMLYVIACLAPLFNGVSGFRRWPDFGFVGHEIHRMSG